MAEQKASSMLAISFSDGLAIGALVLTIVLLVLDKAGKLAGPILFWLLAMAALMTVPLILGNGWVSGSPNGAAKAFRIVFLLCAVGSGYGALSAWIATESTVTPVEPSETSKKHALAGAQIRHLQSIDQFIATKDEVGLRDLFDFPDVLKYNLRFARRNLAPTSVSRAQSEDIDRFFLGGKARLDVRYARVSNVNNRVDDLPRFSQPAIAEDFRCSANSFGVR
jgi:hypothetical protein